MVKVRGDGRCMFRSLAIGLAHLRKLNLSAREEETDADQLRLAVAESMCRSPEKRKSFENAVIAISFEMPMEVRILVECTVVIKRKCTTCNVYWRTRRDCYKPAYLKLRTSRKTDTFRYQSRRRTASGYFHPASGEASPSYWCWRIF